MEKEKFKTYPIIVLFLAFLIAVVVLALATEPQEYNKKEEKALAQLPKIYECSTFDDFAKAWDAYVSDQFPFRDFIIGSKQEAEISSGEDTIVDDVYVLSSDYLFSYTYPTQDKDVNALVSSISKKRTETKLPFIYIVVPQKNLILSDNEVNVDTAVDEANTKRILNALKSNHISYIDCCEYLLSFPLKERANFFYKTDFHWNEYGAYVAATHIANKMAETGRIKITSIPKESDFLWSDLTGLAYLGDLQKRFSEEVTVEEYIPFYVATNEEDFKYYTELKGPEVPRDSIVATGLESDPLDYNKLSTYNLGYIRVENPNAAEKKKVLILKDSYECCMTDYFSEMFEEINIVDPRSNCPSFNDIVKERDIDMILLLYHNSNISQDLIKYLNN